MHDQRGVIYLETLIAVPILFIAFIAIVLFARLSVAHVIVLRAAAAGARAAAVILPDDVEYYGREGAATKEECIEEAVRRVLMASPHFLVDAGAIDVQVRGSRSDFDPLTVEVRAQYDCRRFLGSARFFAHRLCGDDRVLTLGGSSTLAYQLGPVEP